ncbi:MAG: hypothetical protein D6806_08120, partial [Deltaproteobacteria bacterium]
MERREMMNRRWAGALVLVIAFVSVSCQLGRECHDGFCRVDGEEDLWVYERAIMAEEDPNFGSVEVFPDRLVFTGIGPASDFDYRVGDILISSPMSRPAYMRRVVALEERNGKLIAYTVNAG